MKLKKLNEMHQENWEDDINWDEEEQTSSDMIKRELIKKYKQIPSYAKRYMKYSEKGINTFMGQDISNKRIYDVYETDDDGRYDRHIAYVEAGSSLMASIIIAIEKQNPEIFCIGYYRAKAINKEETLAKLKRQSESILKKIDQIENPKNINNLN